jgi:hypothetical protein
MNMNASLYRNTKHHNSREYVYNLKMYQWKQYIHITSEIINQYIINFRVSMIDKVLYEACTKSSRTQTRHSKSICEQGDVQKKNMRKYVYLRT